MPSTARRRSQSPDVISATRGPQWSPRLERKKREEQRVVGHKEERRKTLAELAIEAGYGVSVSAVFSASFSFNFAIRQAQFCATW